MCKLQFLNPTRDSSQALKEYNRKYVRILKKIIISMRAKYSINFN